MQKKALQLLVNPATWVVVALLIIVFVFWRNGRRWWANLTRQDRGNYAGQNRVQSNPAREAELQAMAREAYRVMHILIVTGDQRERALADLLALNDTELRYVAVFYKNSVNPEGVSMRQDIDDEWMPFTDVDEKLIARLTQMAL